MPLIISLTNSSTKCMSVPHTVAMDILITISPSPGSGTGRSIISTLPFAVFMHASTGQPPQIRRGRAHNEHRRRSSVKAGRCSLTVAARSDNLERDPRRRTMAEQTRVELKVTPREVLGKKVSSLRREGIIPANVYGHALDSVAIQVPKEDLAHVMRTAGRNEIVNHPINA